MAADPLDGGQFAQSAIGQGPLGVFLIAAGRVQKAQSAAYGRGTVAASAGPQSWARDHPH